MDKTNLLEKRRLLKRKKPVFIRQNSNKKKVGLKWRKPKGSDSKMRVGFRGHKRSVTKGWKSPAEVRGLTPHGFILRTVNSVKDIEDINPKTESAIIGATVGSRKRVTIIEAAAKKGIKIENYKDAVKFAEKIKQRFQKKKEESEKTKKSREEKKEQAKKEAEKKAKETKKAEEPEEKTEEEKKIEEKKEKDKLLIQTQ